MFVEQKIIYANVEVIRKSRSENTLQRTHRVLFKLRTVAQVRKTNNDQSVFFLKNVLKKRKITHFFYIQNRKEYWPWIFTGLSDFYPIIVTIK